VTRVEENRENGMETHQAGKEKRQPKASAHVCPQCGFAIYLKDFGLREGAIGLVTCFKYGWSGPVIIGIVPKDSTN
jgi:predicted RNA-binding Zn-ribbon protein involved in translation (DUF1610 family)